MGLALPQLAPASEDRVSGAQVIDGSLKFESGLQTYLKRTNSSSGNRKTWTLSVWMKRNLSNATFYQSFFINRTSASYNIRFNRNTSTENNTNFGLGGGALTGSRKFRDTGWFHAVLVYDTTNATEADRIKWYINGQREANFSAATYPSQNTDGEFNRNQEYGIGYYNTNTAWDGSMSQYYFIDGQALGPESFGYTDGLTNTWRPKKYTGTFGTNGFYLPMDGNSPIGEDKSGQGNNWTPVNFGGSVSLDNPIVSGARPILNTDGGGNVARPGVFGSEENLFYTVTTANGSVYQFDITSGNNPSLSFIRGATYRFDYTSHSSHPLRFSSTNPDSSTSAYTDGTNTSVSNVITITVPHNAPNTLYYYCTAHASAMNGSISVTTDETKADPYAWKNTLALPLVGSSSDVSNSVNSGSTTKVIGSGGDPAASSDTSNFYSGSFQFDGNDYLTIPNTTELTMGTGDFTVEFWYKVSSSFAGSNFYVFDFNSNGLRVQLYNNTIAFATGSSLIQVTVNGADTNSWHHIACVRSSSTAILYYNGINVGTFSSTENITMGSTASIGRYGGSGNYYSGYLQDFRVYKGIAKYTSNFIPASTNPDILPDTPSGVSGGSKLAKVTDGAVSFDGTGDYLSVGSNSDFNFGTGTFTIEGFFYKNATTSLQTLLASQQYYQSGYNGNWVLRISSGAQIAFASYDGTGNEEYSEFSAANGVGGWHHFAFVREGTGSNQSKFYYDGKLAGSMTVSKSLTDGGSNGIFIGDDGSGPNNAFNGFLSNVRVIKGTALYTANFTPPTRELTNVTNTKLLCCQSNTSATESVVEPTSINDGTVWSSRCTISSGGAASNKELSNGFDGSVATAFEGDTSGATVTVPVSATISAGGVRVYAAVTSGNPLVVLIKNGGTTVETINGAINGGRWYASSSYAGAITSLVISRTGRAPEFNGIEIDGTILIDGGGAIAVNGNAAATTFNPFTTDINAVRGQETGYYTWNPLSKGNINLSDGNLTAIPGANDQSCFATLSIPDNGKVYFEFTCIQRGGGGAQSPIWGVGDPAGVTLALNPQNSGNNASTWLYGGDGNKTGGGSGSASYGTAFIAGDIIGVCVDRSNSRIWFSKNSVWQNGGNPNNPTDSNAAFTNVTSTGTLIPFYGNNNSTYGYGSVNFGQKPFKYAPPDGFQPLNAANAKPVKVIARSDQYVRATIYTGSNGTNHKITSGIDADLVWIKNRSAAFDSALYDTIRISDGSGGDVAGSSRSLSSNRTLAQGGVGEVSLLSDGFNLHYATANFNASNNYVAWSWRAGGSKNTFNKDDVGYASAAAAGITGLDGTGEMTTAKFLGCSIGTEQGFSIIKYKGLGGGDVKVPHGLSQTPGMVIVKNLDSTVDWAITHSGLPGNRSLRFTNASTSASGFLGLNKAGLSSTYFTINYSDTNLKYVNASNEDYIAYIWHDVPGLQKFGSYAGNNSSDGPFIELGFRPAIILVKSSTNSEHWAIWDTKRSTFNTADDILRPNDAAAELANYSSGEVDFLSNGFKLRGNWGATNGSSQTYIYAAWAEAPTFNLYGAQSNAR